MPQTLCVMTGEEVFHTEVYLYGHWREVPHIDNDSPAGHHPEQITDHVVFTAVPESIAEPRVVLRHTEGKIRLGYVHWNRVGCLKQTVHV